MNDEDYHALERAVMQTEQGRRFLAEYRVRNRSAETETVLAAAADLEHLFEAHAAPDSLNHLRDELAAMADEIDRAKQEIAAIQPDGGAGPFDSASLELDAIVASTEEATSAILTSAEQIQELAWTLRENGTSDADCDKLDQLAVEIYTCCAFQDLTGQRTQKVVNTLRFLEARIGAMRAIWGGAVDGLAQAGAATAENAGDDLLNGPALPGEGMEQDAIDALLGADMAFDETETARPDVEIDDVIDADMVKTALAETEGGMEAALDQGPALEDAAPEATDPDGAPDAAPDVALWDDDSDDGDDEEMADAPSPDAMASPQEEDALSQAPVVDIADHLAMDDMDGSDAAGDDGVAMTPVADDGSDPDPEADTDAAGTDIDGFFDSFSEGEKKALFS